MDAEGVHRHRHTHLDCDEASSLSRGRCSTNRTPLQVPDSAELTVPTESLDSRPCGRTRSRRPRTVELLRRRRTPAVRLRPPPLVSRSDAARRFRDLKTVYRGEGRAVPVSFRDLANDVLVGERLTHRVHPYPATLLRNIPAFLLSVPELAPEGSTVGDPFCGSGTVLLEALSAGFNSLGLDVNPLAVLISRVKTQRLDPCRLATMQRRVFRHPYRHRTFSAPPVVNVGHWFHPHVVAQLAQIDAVLQTLPQGPYLDFLRVCFSSCVRKVSLANPRVSVPVRLRPDAYRGRQSLHRALAKHLESLKRVDVWRVFRRTIRQNEVRVASLSSIPSDSATATVHIGDARAWKLSTQSPLRCPLIITSPPYLAAQKYVRATSLSLNWLRLADPSSLRALERLTLGREHINKDEYISFDAAPHCIRETLAQVARTNPLRAQIAAHYVADLRQFFEQLLSWISPTGHCVLIVAPNTLCGRPFDTPAIIVTLAPRVRILPDSRASRRNPVA